jgi:hypothetical protein
MTAFVRMMWKEYRVLRSFWLALAVFGLACDGLLFVFIAHPQDRLQGLIGFAGIFPIGFALGAGAMLFALEREESTHAFLQYLPARSSRIFASKALTAIVGMLLLALLLLSVSIGDVYKVRAAREAAGQFSGAAYLTLVYTALALQVLGWSVLFSLRSARPLLAAFLGALGAVSSLAVAPFAAMQSGSPRVASHPLTYLAVAAVIWAIDLRLGLCWLHDSRVDRFTIQDDSASSPFRRLWWQQWRHSRRLAAVLLALGVILPCIMWSDPSGGATGVIPAVGLVLALLGACTFHGDQQLMQFRFFAERGISAHAVWRGRQAFWGAAAALLAAVMLAAHLLMIFTGVPGLVDSPVASPWVRPQFVLSWFAVDIGPSGTPEYQWTIQWLSGLAGFCVWVSLAFASGQFCSMFLRSGLLAAVCSVMLAGVLLGWAALMQVLAIGWWWSVAPLAIALFAATWLRSTGWMLERRHWRAWLPPVLTLVFPAASVLAMVPVYRVWEIPEAMISLPGYSPFPPRGVDTGLFRICEMLPLRQIEIEPGAQQRAYDAKLTTDERRWLTENEAPMSEAVERLLQLRSDATIKAARPQAPIEWQPLAVMILRYGQMAAEQDQLDDAWRRYQAVLKLAAFIRRDNGALGEILGGQMEQQTAMQLIVWGAQQGQTVERLLMANEALRELEQQEPPLAEMTGQDYYEYLAVINRMQTTPFEWGEHAVLAARWAPWEFTRARRLLKYEASIRVLQAQAADAALSGRALPAASSRCEADLAKVRLLGRTTLYFEMPDLTRNRQDALCYRRAAQLALAAEAWRLEHGELPEKLSDLEGISFDRLPVDPFNNQPFEWLPWGMRVPVQSRNAGKIAAGTPLVYSAGLETGFVRQRALNALHDLRRRSAHDPIARQKTLLAQGETAALPAGEPGQGAQQAGADLSAAGNAASTPTSSESLATESAQSLEGLAFPIPTEN